MYFLEAVRTQVNNLDSVGILPFYKGTFAIPIPQKLFGEQKTIFSEKMENTKNKKAKSSAENPNKKLFDKRKWRENKYSHKAKLDKWTENRNKGMQRRYFRMLKKEQPGKGANAIPLGEKNATTKPSYKKTKEEFEKRQRQAERKQKQEEKQKRFKERQEAIKLYKEQKAERYKLLSRKTKYGQPSMAGRMQLLFERIKKSS